MARTSVAFVTDGSVLTEPGGLDARAVLAVARGELVPELGDELIGSLDRRRAWMLAALDAGGPVYGVTTGMGKLSEVGLDDAARVRQSEALLTARAVGGPPWLSPAETRAVLAVRLRTFLNGDAAVSAALCVRLAESIALGLLPALPRRSTGVAGEIVGLAHLGAALTGCRRCAGPWAGSWDAPGRASAGGRRSRAAAARTQGGCGADRGRADDHGACRARGRRRPAGPAARADRPGSRVHDHRRRP